MLVIISEVLEEEALEVGGEGALVEEAEEEGEEEEVDQGSSS